jgi:hypothetical protein
MCWCKLVRAQRKGSLAVQSSHKEPVGKGSSGQVPARMREKEVLVPAGMRNIVPNEALCSLVRVASRAGLFVVRESKRSF